MKKKILLSLFIFTAIMVVKSQSPVSEVVPKQGIVKGLVLDVNKKPVEFATVTIYSSNDSSMVTGAISDINGFFTIPEVPFGKYYAEATFVGFNKTISKPFVILPGQLTVDLGQILISPAVESIDEVEIVANRPVVEYKIDKKVINVSENIAADGGTAVDALANAPSVQTDIEGNLTLRGSANFKVYIDGRPSIVDGNEALQQIPANSIDNIELITNPSAKYDPDGTAGIINVIMKKRKSQGINGIINASIGTKGKYSSDVLLNWRTEKFNFFTGAEYGKRNFEMKVNGEEIKNTDLQTTDLVFKNFNRTINFERGGYKLKGGFDYFLNTNNTLTISAEYGGRTRNRSVNSDRTVDTLGNISKFESTSIEESGSNAYQVNLSYVSKFNDKGSQLSMAYFIDGEWGSSVDSLMEYRLMDDNSKFISTYYKSKDDNPEYEMRFNVDYVNPFSGNGKFEAGLQYLNEEADYDYRFYNNLTDIDEPVDSLSQVFKIKRNIYAAYSIFSNSMFGIDYQLGFRIEYTDRYVLADKKYPVQRPDYFPSVHLSKKFNDRNQLMMSYTRRVNRPREWDLNPVRRYIDSETIRSGDPKIKPEYTGSYELNYQYSIDKSFISMELYHKYTRNLFDRTRLDSIGFIFLNFTNIGKTYSTGFEVMSNVVIKKFIILNASYSLYNYRIESPLNIDSNDNEQITWRANFMGTFVAPWKGRFQVNGIYNAPSIGAQGERDGFYALNLGMRQDFFDRKITASVQVQDVLSTMKFYNTTYTPGIVSKTRFKRESPVVMLTLSYKINNYRNKEKSQRGENGGPDINGGGDDIF